MRAMVNLQDALAIASTALMVGIAVMAMVQLALGGRDRPSTLWLLVTLAAVAAMGAGDLASQMGLNRLYRVLQPFSDTALLVIGPALWLYLREVSEGPRVHPRRLTGAAVHLMPAALLCLLLLFGAVFEAPEPQTTHRTIGEIVILLPIACHLIGYAVACAIRVANIRRQTKAYYSDLDDRDLSWLIVMTTLYAAGLAAWILTWQWSVSASNALTGLFTAVATGWMGIRGSRQRVAVAPEVIDEITIDAPAPAPYSKARLPEALAQGLGARLQAAMREDKAYLESDLTLGELARRLEVTAHQLSQYLSMHERQTFYDYVNGWRVDSVKATLMRPGSHRRPLLEIALECGFGSKSAFNSVFKKSTGLSPSEYRAGLPGTAAKATRGESMS